MDTTMNDSRSCSICCEDFDKAKRKEAKCVFCEYGVCFECQKRYLLSLGHDKDPECMACHRVFSREHLAIMFPKTFIDRDLKRHRQDVLFEREKRFLPDTQANLARLAGHVMNKKNTVVRRCPGQGCRGFLRDQDNTDETTLACSLCDTRVCALCLDTKTTRDHACRKEDVETVRLLKDDSQPCPSCGVVIFKISGCSQMWCTSCHTAFDWNTLNIVKNTTQIHNPHYFEYMAERGMGEGNEDGDEEIHQPMATDFIPLHHANASWKDLSVELRGMFYRYLRGFVHMQHVDIPRLDVSTMEDPMGRSNEDVRRKYLTRAMDDVKFKATLQRREKKKEIDREVRLIVRTFVSCGIDVLRKSIGDGITSTTSGRGRWKRMPADENVCREVARELATLIEQSNDALSELRKTFGVKSSVPSLVDTGYDIALVRTCK